MRLALAMALACHVGVLALLVVVVTAAHDPTAVPSETLTDVSFPEFLLPASGQVVEVHVTGPEEEPPPDTTRQAERNMNPAVESVQSAETTVGGAPAQPSTAEAIGEPRPARGNDVPAIPGQPQATAPPPVAAELPIAFPDTTNLPGAPALPEAGPPREGAAVASRARPAPTPDAGTPVMAAAPPPAPEIALAVSRHTNELVPDLPAGEITAVRAHRSERAGYLLTVRDRVQQLWRGAREAYSQAQAQGALRGRSPQSRVDVRVRSDGSVEHAQLVEPSGIEPIDKEAVAVFARAEPFERPPAFILDPGGGIQFIILLAVDDSGASFLQQVRRAVRASWRPSPAFQRAGDHERITLARILLNAQGVLTQASVISSAGIDFLDRGAMLALQNGTRLPGPPGAQVKTGPMPLLIEFHHTVRKPPDVQVMLPSARVVAVPDR